MSQLIYQFISGVTPYGYKVDLCIDGLDPEYFEIVRDELLRYAASLKTRIAEERE